MILAIDTTHDFGSIALVHNGTILEELPLDGEDGFSSLLFTAIQDLLVRHNLTLGQIDAFAAASGPGTFTGIRIGLTVAKGFGESMNKPVFGVSNLEALTSFAPGAIPSISHSMTCCAQKATLSVAWSRASSARSSCS